MCLQIEIAFSVQKATARVAHAAYGYERLLGVDLQQIELQFQSHSLMFAHSGLCVPHVMTQFTVWKREVQNRQERTLLDVYRYGTRLDGGAMSEFLQFTLRENESAPEL
jgi:hypothetical protein